VCCLIHERFVQLIPGKLMLLLVFEQFTVMIFLIIINTVDYPAPHLHLTISKVAVIVWRFKREYYQNCFIYCQRASSSVGTVNKNSLYCPVGSWVLCFIRLHDLSLFLCMFCFTLDSWVIPFMFWRWRNNLKEPPSSCLLPPHYCGLGAGSIPSRAIVNKKQCETRGLFMSLVSTTV